MKNNQTLKKSKKIKSYEDYQKTFLPNNPDTEDTFSETAEESGIKVAKQTILYIRKLLDDYK